MTNLEMEVSCFPNIKIITPAGTQTVEQVVETIRSEKYKDICDRIGLLKKAHLADPKDKAKKDKYQDLKKTLPNFTASGVFSERNNDSLLKHSGAAQIDLDGKDNPGKSMEDMREVLENDPRVFLVLKSPSRDGMKALCRVSASAETHKASCEAMQAYYKEKGFKADTTSDVSRAFFVSSDPDIKTPRDFGDADEYKPLEVDISIFENGKLSTTPPLLTSADQIDPITFADVTPQRPLEDATVALRAIKDAIGRPEYNDRLHILSGMFNSYGQSGYDAVQDVFGTDGFDKPIKHLTEKHTAGTVFHMAAELSRVQSNPLPVASDGDEFLRELESMVASTPDHIRKMEEQARDAVFVLPRIACLGDLTIINARFSTGKTLLTLWLLSQRDLIDTQGLKIFYINADDSFNGAIEKAILAESIGVSELVPGQAGFTSDKLEWIIKSAIKTEHARDVVIILDTLKKFVDTMDKTQARKINLLLREFSGCGGTVIALAHTNKHKIAGESVAEGVGDFLSDFDCAYLMDEIEPTPENVKTIVLKNQKLRNPNAKEVHFIYDTTEGMTWRQRFDSVEMVGNEQAKAVCAEAKANEQHEEDLPTIIYLERRIHSSSEPISATALCQHDLDGDASSRGQRERVLSLYADTNPNELHRHWRQRTMTNKKGIFYTPPEKIEPF